MQKFIASLLRKSAELSFQEEFLWFLFDELQLISRINTET